MRKSRNAGIRAAIALATLRLMCACGGGGDDVTMSTTPSATQAGSGAVEINADSVPSGPTGMPWVDLKGSAFTTSSYVCCSGSAVSDTGVSVTWSNTTTGESGAATQNFGVESFSYFYSLRHTWSARIPLAAGANVIKVIASDGKGNWATETVTVTRVSYATSAAAQTPAPAVAIPAAQPTAQP